MFESRWCSGVSTLVLGATMVACAGPERGQVVARQGVALEASREIVSRVTGDPPNFAQLSNGSMMTVVSRAWGRGAKAGALVECFWPQYDVDHLWDAYVGVELGGTLRWAHALPLVRQAIAPDTGRVTTEFADAGLRLVIEDVMWPERDVTMRRATLTNTGTAVVRGAALAHHAFWHLGGLPGGDRVRFDGGWMLQRDGDVAAAVGADVAPSAGRCGLALAPVGATRDARLAAEAGDWRGAVAAGPAPGGVDAATRHPLPDLAPGKAAAVTWAFAMAAEEGAAKAAAAGALAAGFDAAAHADAKRWRGFLAASREPSRLSGPQRKVYRRALVTMAQHHTTAGALIAAPTNLNPPYKFLWPRDGTLSALTLLEAGHSEASARFFAFAERLQKEDGSFAVNYFPSGRRALWDFGTRGNEHDEPATFAWGVARHAEHTGDAAWAAARWPAVRRACDFLTRMQEPSGLLNTCRDLWELDTDGTWTYTNGAALAAWRAGARLAERQGDRDAAARWQAAAARLEQALARDLVGGAGSWLIRGVRRGRPDVTVEAANLALGAGGFGVLPADHPALAATARAVAERLSAPGGGIRRYEGDRYYDGHPWPVATAWLARHHLAVGDRAQAQAALDTMTRWALTTESAMLGEQFDPARGVWISAFPLVWSEAAYIELALALDRRP